MLVINYKMNLGQMFVCMYFGKAKQFILYIFNLILHA